MKFKKDYFLGVGDFFDFVVIGVYYGKGKCIVVYGVFFFVCYDFDLEYY